MLGKAIANAEPSADRSVSFPRIAAIGPGTVEKIKQYHLAVDLVPEKQFAEEIDPETFGGLQPEDIRLHEKNWFDSIRLNKPTNASIELAVRVQTVISLAEMSDRLKTTCLFDEKARKISDASGKEIKPITYGTLPLS